MFSTKKYLEKKTGLYGVGRFSYLQQLVTEFQDTDSEGAKKEVLANLANFSYDPINYKFLRELNVMDLFLDCLDEDDTSREYAIGGLCNLCLDKQNKDYIIAHNGVNLVKRCLSSSGEETVISAMTTLMFLTTPTSKQDVTSLDVVEAMLRFSNSRNPRIANLATIFLEDYCTKEQIEMAEQFHQNRNPQQQPAQQQPAQEHIPAEDVT